MKPTKRNDRNPYGLTMVRTAFDNTNFSAYKYISYGA